MPNRLRVLVVDDDPAIRALVKAILGRAGFTVDTARDGCEAIERIAAADYDGVILDIMMPRLDGFGVIEALQEIDAELLSRTLVLTASHLQRLEELPVFGVISKPFGIDDLLQQMHTCIESAAMSELAVVPEWARLEELSPVTDH